LTKVAALEKTFMDRLKVLRSKNAEIDKMLKEMKPNHHINVIDQAKKIKFDKFKIKTIDYGDFIALDKLRKKMTKKEKQQAPTSEELLAHIIAEYYDAYVKHPEKKHKKETYNKYSHPAGIKAQNKQRLLEGKNTKNTGGSKSKSTTTLLYGVSSDPHNDYTKLTLKFKKGILEDYTIDIRKGAKVETVE
jgi:hypothetical protein